MNWRLLLQKRSEPKPIKFYTGLSVRAELWRATPELVAQAQRVQGDPAFQQMIEVLRNEAPSNFGLPNGTDISNRAVYQAANEGYQHAIATLLSLAELPKKQIVLEETFEPSPLQPK